MKQSTNILFRAITAILGGYGLSSGLSIALVPVFSILFDFTLANSVLLASMLSYLAFFIIIIISFSINKLWHFWASTVFIAFILLVFYKTVSFV